MPKMRCKYWRGDWRCAQEAEPGRRYCKKHLDDGEPAAGSAARPRKAVRTARKPRKAAKK